MNVSNYSVFSIKHLQQADRKEIDLLSRHYPFDAHLLQVFGGFLNWHHLSRNRQIYWTENLINQFANLWDWKALSANPMLTWSARLLERFEKNWDWEVLGTKAWQYDRYGNTWTGYPFLWTKELFLSFSAKIYWAYPLWQDGELECFTGLINHPDIIWTPELYAACNKHITKHFKLLYAEVADIIVHQEDMVLRNPQTGQIRQWTYYQGWANWEGEVSWSFDYLNHLLNLSKLQPDIEFINWEMIRLPIKIRANPQFEPLCRAHGLKAVS